MASSDNNGAGAVTPISAGTGAVGLPIETGAGGPIISTPDGTTLYVAGVEGTATPVPAATDTAGPPITVAQDPDVIVITPDSKRAHILSYHGTVTPVVTPTNTAGHTILVADAVDKGMVLAP